METKTIGKIVVRIDFPGREISPWSGELYGDYSYDPITNKDSGDGVYNWITKGTKMGNFLPKRRAEPSKSWLDNRIKKLAITIEQKTKKKVLVKKEEELAFIRKYTKKLAPNIKNEDFLGDIQEASWRNPYRQDVIKNGQLLKSFIIRGIRAGVGTRYGTKTRQVKAEDITLRNNYWSIYTDQYKEEKFPYIEISYKTFDKDKYTKNEASPFFQIIKADIKKLADEYLAYVRNRIISGQVFPPLEDSTIKNRKSSQQRMAKKGYSIVSFDKPLYATGTMLKYMRCSIYHNGKKIMF